MAFSLLLLLTAIYFIRPSEWIPGVSSMPLYQLTILPCVALSSNLWTREFDSQSLGRYPISACVLGLLGIAFLSSLFNGCGIDFVGGYSKAIIFYFLMVSIVNSQMLLSIFLQSLASILFIMALIVILYHHGIMSVSDNSGILAVGTSRLEAQGTSFDPNDTAALIVLGILISLHYMISARRVALRPVWLGLAFVQIYVLQLTDSRGGFLALITGLGVYTWVRWGKKGLLWGSCMLPIIVIKLATERMSTIGSSFTNDTGQSRIQFWCEGILLLKHNPLFGIGPNQAVPHVGKALHNTFIQAFAELGFFGGVFFLAAFSYGLFTTFCLTRSLRAEDELTSSIDPTLPLICSLLAAYGMAILSLNHLYATNTYILLGLTTITARLHGVENFIPTSTLFTRYAIVGAIFVVLSHITARALVQW